MKNIILVLLTVFAFSSMAESFGQGIGLNEGDYLLTPTEGTYSVDQLVPVCAPEMRCAPSTVVTFTYTAGGCLDTVEHFYTVEENTRSIGVTILVSAMNISNEASKSVRCIAMPIVQKSITLPYYLMEGQVDVKFIGLVPEQN